MNGGRKKITLTAKVCLAAALTLAPMAALAQTETPMTFAPGADNANEFAKRVVIDHLVPRIYAVGVITEDSADRLRAYAHQRRLSHAKIVLDSPGGSLIGGLRLGMAIRDLEFDTEVGTEAWNEDNHAASICASACAYAFAGGVSRYYGLNSRIGVHQFAGSGAGSLRAGQEVSALVVNYLHDMGVDTTAFAVASRATPDDMTWLDEPAALQLGLANNGTLPTIAEIKISEGAPYLRLEQTRREVTGRALLMCGTKGYLLGVGVVTDAETTTSRAKEVTRAYIEIDHRPFGVMTGPGSIQPSGDVIWVTRGVTKAEIQRLVGARDLDVWTENGGPMRWGAGIDLTKVQPQVASFVANCMPTGSL